MRDLNSSSRALGRSRRRRRSHGPLRSGAFICLTHSPFPILSKIGVVLRRMKNAYNTQG